MSRSRFATACGLLASLTLLIGCASTPAEGDAPEIREEGALVFEGIPPIPDAVRARLSQYQEVRSAALRGWLPDGSLLVSTRFAETAQIHRVDTPGGARRQLTFFAEPVSSAVPSPDRTRPGFFFLRDEGGSEFHQVYFFDLASGEIRRLTEGNARNGGIQVSADGSRVAFASTARNGRDTDVWVGSDRPGEQRLVTESEGTWYPVEFSPDGAQLLVYRYISRAHAQLWVADLESGALTAVVDPDQRVRIDDAAFAPGGGFYVAADFDGEFVGLHHLAEPLAEPQPVTGPARGNVEELEISPDGQWMAWIVNQETLSRLHVRNLDDNRFVALPELPPGVMYGLAFRADGGAIGVTINGATSPGDVYTVDLERRVVDRWTHSEVGGLDTSRFGEPEHFRFPTFDEDPATGRKRTIPAYIYRPVPSGTAATEPLPVIVSIHGGPESQARPWFSSTYQYWVNELGFAVVVPNVRGSTGYGRSYHLLDNGYGREDSVRDIGALLDWIEAQPDLDADRVIVQGGSYGGYMVLATMTLYPERILAGIESVGISNFVTFLENTQDYRRDLRRAEYGDERDPAMRAFLEEISPLNRVERIEAPLLVVQGANDPRVPASESRQIVDSLAARGHEVWYLLARDEGHGFRKRGNRDAQAAVRSMFLENLLERAP